MKGLRRSDSVKRRKKGREMIFPRKNKSETVARGLPLQQGALERPRFLLAIKCLKTEWTPKVYFAGTLRFVLNLVRILLIIFEKKPSGP